MDEQTQNVATALKWCQDENQKLRQELYDLKHDKEVLEARNEELEEELTEVKEENDNWEADDANLTKIIYMINALDDEFSVGGVDDIYDCIKNLNEQLKQLKEENEKLDAKMLGYLADRNYQKLKTESLEEENKMYEEQLKQQNEWFEEINRLVGADPSEPSVNAVSDYVREHS